MKEYIDKSALVAEIDKHLSYYKDLKDRGILSKEGEAAYRVVRILKSDINSIEVKEVEDELQGLEKEVAEGTVNRINKKRIPIELKGEVKAKFKNEFHTMWQTIHGISFANVAKPILERLCLHFAAWGSYNLKGIGQIDKDGKKEIDVEVKELDLE